MMNKLYRGAAFYPELWSGEVVREDIRRMAESVGTLIGGPSPGLSFLTETKRGQGRIMLLGSLPAGDEGSEMLERMLIHYGKEANVTRMAEVTIGTIVAPRESETEELWVIVNMNGEGGSVTLPREGFDKLSGERVAAGRDGGRPL
uniref:Beta-galactosidase C-terminal domain n=1 Tax=Paenibacillus terrae TaxID=159743 RepID=UPI001643E44D|nr:Beta-galactosidase C-terminal domain [Paenibacillus terrae]